MAARLGIRRCSTTSVSRTTTIRPSVPPSCEMSRSTAVDALVACWAPKRAAERSHSAKPRLRRTMNSSRPTPTPPTMTIAPATVSARPVVACGSTRARSICASRP